MIMTIMMMIMIMIMMMAINNPARAHTNAVVDYWEERLQGARMPITLRAMLPPLDSQQATALRNQIVSDPDFLPAHASAFCQATHMQCQLPTYSQRGHSNIFLYANDTVPSISDDDAPHLRGHGLTFFRKNQTLVAGARIQVKADLPDAGDNVEERAFLPRELAQLFPIAGKKAIPNIHSMLGIPESALPSMEAAVAHCDQGMRLPGEEKACITSIEDLADFATYIMETGPPHRMIVVDASEVPTMSIDTTHTVIAVKPITEDPNVDKYVACHDMLFPFRLFYCHYIQQTRLFLATIQAEDGSLYNRVAVCHYDTSSWNPSHTAFSELHTKPGESEACHWVGEFSLCFVPAQSSDALL